MYFIYYYQSEKLTPSNSNPTIDTDGFFDTFGV